MGWVETSIVLAGAVRLALRRAIRAPGHTAAMVLTLGLGVGANAALLSVIDATLVRPPRFRRPAELYEIAAAYPASEEHTTASRVPYLTGPAARALEETGEAPRRVAAHAWARVARTDGSEPTSENVAALEPGLLGVLGVSPSLGRAFDASDALPGAPPVVLVSHGFWLRELGGDPGALGRTLTLDAIRYEVVGVMPGEFRFPLSTICDLWVPLPSDGTLFGHPARFVQLVARVPEGEVARTSAALATLADAPDIQSRGPAGPGWTPELMPLARPTVATDVQAALLIALGAAGLMLLVAVVNGVNLSLAHDIARIGEASMRLALGASRRRVAMHFLVEKSVPAVLSGACAVAIAAAGVVLLAHVAPPDLTDFAVNPVTVNGRTVAFVGALSAAAAIFYGLLSTLLLVRAAQTSAATPRTAGISTPTHRRVRSILVVSQVVVCMLLLSGAGLLGRSFYRLIHVDPGFDVDRVSVMALSLSPAALPTPESRSTFVSELADRFAAIPGVEDVSLSVGAPPSAGLSGRAGVWLEGREAPILDGGEGVPTLQVDGAFARTMGIRIVQGRSLSAEDVPDDHRVLVDVDLARRLADGGDALGVRFRLEPDGPWRTVVGITEDLDLREPGERPDRMALMELLDPTRMGGYVTILVRTGVPPASISTLLRRAVRRFAVDQPIQSLAPMAGRMQDGLVRPRFFATLMTVFSALALLLAAVGLYGLLSFMVERRRQEMGIRAALGASPAQIRSLVVRDGLSLAAAGIAIGAVVWVGTARLLRGLLYRTPTTDPAVPVTVALVLLLVAASASCIPAWHATRADPSKAVRGE